MFAMNAISLNRGTHIYTPNLQSVTEILKSADLITLLEEE
jgi:hypothetical protein